MTGCIEERIVRGSCLCGACRFTARLQSYDASVCHCGMCRKWSGGAFLVTDCGSSVQFEDREHLETYRASDWGERVFCKTCGSSLLWQTQDGLQQYVSIQAFDVPLSGAAGFELTGQIFIDCKPEGYAFAGKTDNMTEAEVFAMYADKET